MKNKNILLVFGVLILGLIVVVAIVFIPRDNSDLVNEQLSGEQADDENPIIDLVEDGEAPQNDQVVERKDPAENANADRTGVYLDYDDSMLTDGTNILFFHAGWCPTCKVLDNDINESLVDIPADVTILKVNYDQELDLRKEYGVTYQHTLVLVDNDGMLLKKWGNSMSLESLLSEI